MRTGPCLGLQDGAHCPRRVQPHVLRKLAPCKHTLWVCSSVSVRTHCSIRYALHESPRGSRDFSNHKVLES